MYVDCMDWILMRHYEKPGVDFVCPKDHMFEFLDRYFRKNIQNIIALSVYNC